MLDRNQTAKSTEASRAPDINPVNLDEAKLPARPEVPRLLEERVAAFVSAVSARLSQSELPRRAYSELVFDAAKEQGLVEGQYGFETASRVGHLMYQLERTLGVRTHYGLNDDYHSLPKLPLGPQASADVAGYQKLEKETGEHLRATIGSKPVNEQTFSSSVKAFVNQWIEATCSPESTAYSSSFQRAGLQGHMIGRYQREFDVRAAKPKWGDIDLDDLNDAFGRL